jgi:hypothetical protein
MTATLTRSLGWLALALAGSLLWLSLLDFPLVMPSTELDNSWAQAMGHFLKHRVQAGDTYFFSYGPLGYLVAPTFDPDLFWIRFAWEVIAKAIFAWTFVRLTRTFPSIWLRALVLLIVAIFAHRIVTMPDVLCLFVIVAQLTFLLERDQRFPWTMVLFRLMFVAALSLIKFTLLLYSVAGLAVVVVHLLFAREARRAIWMLACGVTAFLAVWWAIGQDVSHVPGYFYGSMQVAAGYTESMALKGKSQETTIALILLALLGGWILASAWRAENRNRWPSGGLVALAAFVMWKNGFVRHDHHSFAFFAFCFLLPVLLPRTRPYRGIPSTQWAVPALIWLLSLGGMHQALANNQFEASLDPRLLIHHSAARDEASALSLADPQGLKDRLNAQMQTHADALQLPRIKAVIGDEPVDMISHEQGLVLANRLNWKPRPAFQSYFACTPFLIRRNRDFLTGPDAPRYLILSLEPIDWRLPTLEDSAALFTIFHRYRPVLIERGYLLLVRHASAVSDDSPDELDRDDRRIFIGEEITLPPDERPRKIRLDLQLTTRGRIAKLLFKLPPVYLHVRLTDGHVQRFRLIPEMARDGFLLDPLLVTNSDVLRLYGGAPGRRIAAFTVYQKPRNRGYYKNAIAMSMASVARCVGNSLSEIELNRLHYPGFTIIPDDVRSNCSVSLAEVDSTDVVIVHAHGEMTFTIPRGASRLRAKFGIMPVAHRPGTSDGVCFQVVLQPDEGGEQRVLFERFLDPQNVSDDRGVQQLSVTLPPGASGALCLRTINPPGKGAEWDWSFWSGVGLD